MSLVIEKTEKLMDENEVFNANAFEGTDHQEADMFVESFWCWKSFNHYLAALLIMTTVLIIMTYLMMESSAYVALLGTTSSAIEACLGLP